jgi:RNA polymerase sigma-70 factor (ECF subfamily)
LEKFEKSLVQQFRSGDETAFARVMEELRGRIYRFSLRFADSKEDAEDILIMTFTEAFHSRRRFDERSSLETWIYQIAVHMGYRVRRKNRRTSRLDEFVPDARSNERFRTVELEQEVRRLPDPMRAAFLLVKLEGLSYKEAAEILGRPMGTVQAQVHHASKRIRQSLLSDEPSPCSESLEKYGYEM